MSASVFLRGTLMILDCKCPCIHFLYLNKNEVKWWWLLSIKLLLFTVKRRLLLEGRFSIIHLHYVYCLLLSSMTQKDWVIQLNFIVWILTISVKWNLMDCLQGHDVKWRLLVVNETVLSVSIAHEVKWRVLASN